MGGGRRHREAVLYKNAGSRVFYDWLIKNDFPDGFRVLCYNCNMSLGFNGYFPHRSGVLLRRNNMRN